MPVAFVFDVDIQPVPEKSLHILPQELAGKRYDAVQAAVSFVTSAINSATSAHSSAMADSSTSRNPSYSATFRF